MRTLLCLWVLSFCAVAVHAVAPQVKEPAEWSKLIEQLGDDDDDVVKKAAETKLAALGEAVVPLLRRVGTKHSDVDVRLRSVILISQIEGKLYVEVRKYAGSGDGLAVFALSPDGKRMASGCWGGNLDSRVRVWDVTTGKELHELKGHDSSVPALAFSPDGKQILSGGVDRTLRLWDAGDGKLIRTIENTHAGFVHAVLFSLDGKKAVSCGQDKPINVWDLATGKLDRRIEVNNAVVRSLAWMPDGKRLVSASFDGVVRITDFATGKEVRKMGKGHAPGAAWFVAVSPDGERIASTGSDGLVRLWDAKTGEQLKVFAGHKQGVHGIAYSRDGKRLLSCAEGVRLWDVASGKELQRIETPARVTCVAFSPDDRHAVFSCYDKTLRLWRVRR